MFVKELFTPGRRVRSQVQIRKIPSLHTGRRLQAGGSQNRGGQIDIQSERIVRCSMQPNWHSWIVDHKWDADTFFVRVPLSSETMFSVVETIVGRKDEHGLVQNTLCIQFVPDGLAGGVNARNESKVIFHHFIVLLWIVKTVTVSISTLIVFFEQFGQSLEGCFHIVGWTNGNIFVDVEGFILRKKLLWISIPRVRSKECYRQVKWLVFPLFRFQKVDSVILISSCCVDWKLVMIISGGTGVREQTFCSDILRTRRSFETYSALGFLGTSDAHNIPASDDSSLYCHGQVMSQIYVNKPFFSTDNPIMFFTYD